MKKVSRRLFVKGTVTAMGAVGMAPLVRAQTSISNLSNYSRLSTSHWGAFQAQVQGGRMVRAVPFVRDAFPVPMTQAMPDLLYSPSRVKYPMVRKSFLKDRSKSDTTKRGSEPFVRVSWDEALDIVAGELKRVIGSYGNRSIYGGSYGWQSAGRFHGASASLQRLLGLLGGYVSYVNTYSAPVLPVITPHVLGDPRPRASAWPTIIKNSKLVVLFGYDPLVSAQIVSGDGAHFDAGWITELKRAKIPVVSINPIEEDTDRYLGTERIAIRPNTDTAFMLALAYVLYTEKLHDPEFLSKYTVGFEKFADYLMGKPDGIPKTPEWAAAITEVPAETIRNLARRMGNNLTTLIGGFSLQRAEHGEQPVWMMITLSAMLGKFGLPGGGVQSNFPGGLGNVVGTAPGVPGFSGGGNPVKDYVPVNMWTDLLLNPGKTIDYNGRKITYPDIKLVYWAGGNPLHHAQDINRVVKAWQRPEVIIVNEINWTATAKYADIVLPVTTTLERNDISASSRFILAMQQAVEPLYEARSDYDIFADLAVRFGLKDKYTEGKDEMGWLKQIYGVAQQQGKAKGLNLPDFDAFWKKGYLEFPVTDSAMQAVAYAEFRADPVTNPLGTPSGKIEIFSEKIASFNYDDCPGHPTWLEPSEWLGGAKAKTYPLHLLTSHPKYRLHSQLDNTFIRAWYEVNEREPVLMNPADAAARGLKDGDVVRVFNDRGQTLAGLVTSKVIRPGVAQMREGGWYDPLEPGKIGTLDKHGNVNAVTTDKGDSKLAQGNPSNTALVQIEKYTGALPSISAFTPPTVE